MVLWSCSQNKIQTLHCGSQDHYPTLDFLSYSPPLPLLTHSAPDMLLIFFPSPALPNYRLVHLLSFLPGVFGPRSSYGWFLVIIQISTQTRTQRETPLPKPTKVAASLLALFSIYQEKNRLAVLFLQQLLLYVITVYSCLLIHCLPQLECKSSMKAAALSALFIVLYAVPSKQQRLTNIY